MINNSFCQNTVAATMILIVFLFFMTVVAKTKLLEFYCSNSNCYKYGIFEGIDFHGKFFFFFFKESQTNALFLVQNGNYQSLK